jgi:hypothetical protein
MSDDQPNRSDRTDRILARDFTADLQDMATDDIRARRDDARAELDYLSYLRRLIQSRQDMLTAEREARGRPGQFRAPLAEVLSGQGHQSSRGEAVHLQLPPDDMAAADARVSDILAEDAFANPKELTDEQIDTMVATLHHEEQAVSSDRGAVIRAHDKLQEELKRRYREDPSQIPQEV